MNDQDLHQLLDELLAQEQAYRPLSLLRRVHRLAAEDERRFRAGEIGLLEKHLFGAPGRAAALLTQAAAWARHRGLSAEPERVATGAPRVFANPHQEQLARTHWQRPAGNPQGDLFLDTGFAQARSGLIKSLLQADRDAAERYLSDMARAESGHVDQADAEHLVGALDWLDQPTAGLAGYLRAELLPRAQRLMGQTQAAEFVRRFRQVLAQHPFSQAFNPAEPDQHCSAWWFELQEWAQTVTACQRALAEQPAAFDSPPLLSRLATAGFKGGDREQALLAVCQLCWRHPEAAERWLETTEDSEVARRIARFWDMDPLLPIALFPAWLALEGHAPAPPPDDQLPPSPAAAALAQVRALRHDPESLAAREWLQSEQPELFRLWLAQQTRP